MLGIITHTYTQTCKHRQTGSSHCSSFVLFRNTSHMFCTRLANWGLFPTGDPIVPFVISPRFECLNKLTHTQSCFTYTVWTFFCSRVLKKIKIFKPLPFPLKIFGADFVSVFPLNILLHFETDNIPKRLLFEKIENIKFLKTLCGRV